MSTAQQRFNSDMGQVLKNLNQELGYIKSGTRAGLLQAGLLVQRRSQPRAPSEHGGAGLVGSAYTRFSPEDPNVVEIGYAAAYALYVHENLEQKLKGQPRPSGLGVYWGPEGEPKFLERPLNESRADILRLVQAAARPRKRGRT